MDNRHSATSSPWIYDDLNSPISNSQHQQQALLQTSSPASNNDQNNTPTPPPPNAQNHDNFQNFLDFTSSLPFDMQKQHQQQISQTQQQQMMPVSQQFSPSDPSFSFSNQQQMLLSQIQNTQQKQMLLQQNQQQNQQMSQLNNLQMNLLQQNLMNQGYSNENRQSDSLSNQPSPPSLSMNNTNNNSQTPNSPQNGQSLQNTNINSLTSGNPESLDTILRDFFQEYSGNQNLDTFMIDNALTSPPSSTTIQATTGPSPNYSNNNNEPSPIDTKYPHNQPNLALPPPTPTSQTLDHQNSIMPNEIFCSPLTGPMDKSSTTGSNTTEEFTPLMSPATSTFEPINPGIMPPTSDFSMPNSFFSSASPMIDDNSKMLQSPVQQQDIFLNMNNNNNPVSPPAQQVQQQQQQTSAVNPASIPATTSGVSANRRMRKGSSKRSTPVLAPLISKSQLTNSSAGSTSTSRIAKQSPKIRPSRRSSSALSSLASSANTSPMMTPMGSGNYTTNNTSSSSDPQGWSSDSVSPEGLGDLSMPPPQKRSQQTTPNSRPVIIPVVTRSAAKSGTRTPSVSGQSTPKSQEPNTTSASSKSGIVAAVTPASLMNLPEQRDVEMIDSDSTELHLRDAVQAGRNIEKLERRKSSTTSISSTNSSTSSRKPSISKSPLTVSANTTPSTTPATNKKWPRKGSATKVMLPSPKLNAQGSGSSTMIKPKLSVSQPSWKSRNGSSSSPVIRPKISPHISPNMDGSSSLTSTPQLLPATSNSHSRHASISGSSGSPVINGTDLSAYLASKSNYQNIVDGTHSQLGLSYPESLSADLTSKRTSHKLAEQGRRNRINSALADLAKLLAPTHQASSKASTVEMAIEYIRSLKAELKETKVKLSQYEDVDLPSDDDSTNKTGNSNSTTTTKASSQDENDNKPVRSTKSTTSLPDLKNDASKSSKADAASTEKSSTVSAWKQSKSKIIESSKSTVKKPVSRKGSVDKSSTSESSPGDEDAKTDERKDSNDIEKVKSDGILTST